MEKMSVLARKLCSAIVSDGLTFPVLQRGQSSGIGLHFFFAFSRTSHYCCLVPGDRIQKKAPAGLTDRTGYDLL